ncbi:MAG: NUDIX hydrolase [Myxococcota bacterium]
MPSLDDIRGTFAGRRPAVIGEDGVRRAGVAMVLRDDPEGPSVLFIERARFEGDPWSGHMAFPGGRVDPGDADARRAAERETLEEVGLTLAGAEFIGALDDRQGNPRTHGTLIISGYVYAVSDPPPLVPNHEVEKAFWFPLRDLRAPENHVPYRAHQQLDFPGILVGDPERHIVWGLTYNFLEGFFSVVGKPLPDRWTPEMRQYARHIERP